MSCFRPVPVGRKSLCLLVAASRADAAPVSKLPFTILTRRSWKMCPSCAVSKLEGRRRGRAGVPDRCVCRGRKRLCGATREGGVSRCGSRSVGRRRPLATRQRGVRAATRPQGWPALGHLPPGSTLAVSGGGFASPETALRGAARWGQTAFGTGAGRLRASREAA